MHGSVQLRSRIIVSYGPVVFNNTCSLFAWRILIFSISVFISQLTDRNSLASCFAGWWFSWCAHKFHNTSVWKYLHYHGSSHQHGNLDSQSGMPTTEPYDQQQKWSYFFFCCWDCYHAITVVGSWYPNRRHVLWLLPYSRHPGKLHDRWAKRGQFLSVLFHPPAVLTTLL